MIIRFAMLASLVVALAGCTTQMTAQQHRDAVDDKGADALTVGTVQKEIRMGMSGAEVAAALGSPNVVTSDEQHGETWIYDKISTEKAFSTTLGDGKVLILGDYFNQSASGAMSSTQKTLTVIIKFNKAGKVRDFAYHSSKF